MRHSEEIHRFDPGVKRLMKIKAQRNAIREEPQLPF